MDHVLFCLCVLDSVVTEISPVNVSLHYFELCFYNQCFMFYFQTDALSIKETSLLENLLGTVYILHFTHL